VIAVVLLERQSRRRESGARPRGTRRMLADESLQMLIRRGPIAACLFQFGEREERIVGVRRERILDDHATIVSLGIRCGLRQRTAPEERVTVCRRSLGRRAQQRVYERATRWTVPLAHEPARAPEDRVGGGERGGAAVASLCVGPVREYTQRHDGGKSDSWKAMHHGEGDAVLRRRDVPRARTGPVRER